MDKDTAPSRSMVSKLLKLNGYGDKFDGLLRDYPLLIALPYLVDRKSALEEACRHSKSADMLTAFHEIYSKHFSGDEVLDIIAFYKTPTGQKLVAEDEQMRIEMQQATLKLAIDTALEIIKENIDKERKKNDASQPDEDAE